MARDYDAIRTNGMAYLVSVFGADAVERAVDVTTRFTVEVPGWQLWDGFGGGGRFEGGGTGGAARNTAEIAADVGVIHRLTKATPTVGQHVLWFLSKDGMEGDMDTAENVRDELAAEGLVMGSISPTYFLAGSEDGSLSSQDAVTRERYVRQTVFAAEVATEYSNGLVTIWFPDGTNYPGQRELQDKIGLMRDGLAAFWSGVSSTVKEKLDRVLVEYKVFEPGTYSTTVPDWGTARELSRIMGDKGGVLVDMGHHQQGTNIEQIVSNLITFGVRSGFHFNTRYAADDDHSVQADYPLARLFYELIRGGVVVNPDTSANWVYALDQMARTEQRIPSVLKSIDALKRSIAKAALVECTVLEGNQSAQDMIGANETLERALLHTDTSPIVMEAYVRQGLHPVPMDAYRESDYQERVEADRK